MSSDKTIYGYRCKYCGRKLRVAKHEVPAECYLCKRKHKVPRAPKVDPYHISL